VINAKGLISPRAVPGYDDLQRRMLEAEGVVFDVGGKVSLSDYGWEPRSVPELDQVL
jgi:methylated-DNA-protein-cysteine methyltransferase-like protein